jgi:UDPglucose 6-dehydrogenase
VLDGAHGLVILTDWQEFRNPDFETMASRLKHAVIFDGRNLYDPKMMCKAGFEYHAIGRPFLSAPEASA